MLFKKKSALVYITSSNIKVYKSKKLCEEVAFPQDSFKDYLIYDTASIKGVISSVISKCSLDKISISVILDESLYFRYDFDKVSPNQDDITMALSYVPLESNDIAYKIVGAGNKSMVASSKSICGFFQSVFENMDVKISGVFPSIVFSNADPSLVDLKSLNSKKVARLLNDSCNFIADGSSSLKLNERNQKSKLKLYLLYTFVLLSFCALLYSVWFSFRVNLISQDPENNPTSNIGNTEHSKPTPVAENKEKAPTPVVEKQVKKSDLKIIVLNASGAPGLAKNTSDNLEEFGFSGIEIGNYDREQQVSNLFYKEGITKEYLEEINTYLISTFDEVDVKANQSLAGYEDYDLVIIAGSLLTL